MFQKSYSTVVLVDGMITLGTEGSALSNYGSHARKSSVHLPEFLPGLSESIPHSFSVVGACAKDEKLFAIDTALFIIWANFGFASNHPLF